MSEDDVPIEASTPVTGQSRMDSAWGSESESVASVARPSTQQVRSLSRSTNHGMAL